MAVEFTKQPSAGGTPTNLPITQCIDFKIKNDTAETGGLSNPTHRLAWELQTSAGDTVFPRSGIDYPVNGEEISIDFKKDFLENGLITTPRPEFWTAETAQSGMFETYRLKAWDLILDNDCAVGASFSNELTSNNFRVVNIAVQRHDELDLSKMFAMTDRPANYTMCDNQYDWIYIWIPPDSVAAHTIDITTGIGVSPSTTTINLAVGNIWAIPFGSAGALTGNAGNFSIELFADAVRQAVYTVTLEKCCCDADEAEIYFLEPKGGFKSWRFCQTSKDIVTNATEICKIQSCDLTLNERLAESGKTMVDITHYEKLTLNKTIDLTKENERMVKGFLSNPNKFIRWTDYEGNDKIIKFLTESATYKLFEKGAFIELQVVGYYNTELETQPINY